VTGAHGVHALPPAVEVNNSGPDLVTVANVMAQQKWLAHAMFIHAKVRTIIIAEPLKHFTLHVQFFVILYFFFLHFVCESNNHPLLLFILFCI
jgi:hypothetical protein